MDYLKPLREGTKLTLVQQLMLVVHLSIPAILAQISSVLMQYIDASMVGRLGANDSASIGLIASTTWLVQGLMSAAAIGFTVQVAHRIGAREEARARSVVRTGLLVCFAVSLCLMAACMMISGVLPRLLGGGEAIAPHASAYFRLYSMGLPALQMVYTAGGMLQCSGNMRLPSALDILMCVMDVVFNALLIFPSGTIRLPLVNAALPGADLGVRGAALGTVLAEVLCALMMLYFLLFRSEKLALRYGAEEKGRRGILTRALKLSVPVGVEQIIIGGAYIAATKIVSPLGTIAIAANSFAITAESLCYMPGHGMAVAATTIIGQCVGSGRPQTAKRLGFITTFFGMAVMTVMGLLMYLFAPQMIGILTPDAEIRALGARVLRIEAFAEPLFAASMVASGVFRGAGDTLVPSVLNLISMWCVRLPAAYVLSHTLGLAGVWIAMCVELCVRGTLFLIRLWQKKF